MLGCQHEKEYFCTRNGQVRGEQNRAADFRRKEITNYMYSTQIKEYLSNHGGKELRLRAVLFDMDGVLYDSMPNHATSWHESMKLHGLKMAPEEAYTYEGMRGVETIKLLAKRQWNRVLTDEEAAKMYETKARIFSQCPPARVMPGIKQLMQQVKDAGLKIVIVTGSGQRSLLSKLEEEFPGLVSSTLTVTSFDVTHGKPDPEPYLCGLRKAEVKPTEALVVENAPLGVRAGVAAGIFTIAVNTGPLPNEDLSREGANLIFPTMTSLSDAWQTLYSETKSTTI